MLLDSLDCLFSGIGVVINAVLSVFPIINQINNLRDQLIASAIGVPTAFISIVFLIPIAFRILKRVL